jgi:hypothetical protein
VGDRRRAPDPVVIDALAEDMARHGLLQPIGVRQCRQGGRYDLIWGCGRLEAAAATGMRIGSGERRHPRQARCVHDRPRTAQTGPKRSPEFGSQPGAVTAALGVQILSSVGTGVNGGEKMHRRGGTRMHQVA